MAQAKLTWGGATTLVLLVWVIYGVWFETGPYTAIAMFVIISLFGYQCRISQMTIDTMKITTQLIQNLKDEMAETNRVGSVYKKQDTE